SNGPAVLDAEGIRVAQERLTRRFQGHFPAVTRRIDMVISIQDEGLAGMLFPALPEQGPVRFRQCRVPLGVKHLQRMPFGARGARQIPRTIPAWLHHYEASSQWLPAQEF